MFSKIAVLSSAIAAVSAQGVGTLSPERHPAVPIQQCTAKGACTTLATTVVLDSNWRWLHNNAGYDNCYTGNAWNVTHCPDGKTCASKCALEGADYSGTYGITTPSSGALSLKFVTTHAYGKNVGARVYLMAPNSEDKYFMFKLLNKEFTFDVLTAGLPCGLNGALYFSEMPEDGGKAKFPSNKAGAKYGTGYCDAQCPHDIKFINGEANVEGWNPSASDPNGGTGKYGTCCPEMDIWEANSISTAYTPHPCSVPGLSRCTGLACGDGADRYKGVCDKDGCDWNSYRMGDTEFYGPGKKLDSTKTMTVVTQFITKDGTDKGQLSEIRRIYKQNGVVVQNSVSKIPGITGDSLTDSVCNQQKAVFGDNTHYQQLGGTAGMGKAMGAGVVLSMSIWDDHFAYMLWLDSTYPTDAPASKPGAARGTCATTSGRPKDVEAASPNSNVIFSNIKFGPLGSTF